MGKGRKKKKHNVNLFLIFLLTFAGVVLTGVIFILGTAIWKNRGAETAQRTSISLVTEKIPEQELQKNEDQAERTKQTEQDDWTENQTEVSLTFGGDILFDPGYSMIARMNQRENGIYDSIAPSLMEEMRAADIMMLNNEFAYSTRGTPTPEKQFTFRAKPESASLLNDMGVDIVSLANNHAYDYGEAALLDSMDALEAVDVKYVGAGNNLEEAASPVYFEVNGIKIGYLSATQIERLDNPDTRGATETAPGVFRCWNPDKLLEVIEDTKANCDFLVVYIHWGTENTDELDWAQKDQAPKIVEAGADLIIGDHPHCLQEIQYIDDVPIIYSVGNFWFNSKQVDTCLVKAVIDKNGLKSFQFIPALQKDCTTSLLEGDEKERVLSYMRSISPQVIIDEEGFVIKK